MFEFKIQYTPIYREKIPFYNFNLNKKANGIQHDSQINRIITIYVASLALIILTNNIFSKTKETKF